MSVSGWIGEFFGIDQRVAGEPCVVTMLHTGTTCNSLFSDYQRANAARLGLAVDRLECACLIELYSLLDMPFGAEKYDPPHKDAIEIIKSTALALRVASA